jgi:hypothetical protein
VQAARQIFRTAAMGGASRLEALHFALSPSHRLMEVFRWIILSEPLLMPCRENTDIFCESDRRFESRFLLPKSLFFAGSISRW